MPNGIEAVLVFYRGTCSLRPNGELDLDGASAFPYNANAAVEGSHMTPDEQKLRRAERFVWHLRASATMGSALSVLFFILAIPAFVFEARFVHSAIRASGVVTKIVPKDRNVRVVYAFHDANGVSYHGSDVCWPRVYTIGEKVDLLYVPGRTGARAEIVGFWNQWILTAFCLGGCLVIALGSLRLRSYYRSYRRRLDAWKAKAAVTS